MTALAEALCDNGGLSQRLVVMLASVSEALCVNQASVSETLCGNAGFSVRGDMW